jgi:hypothetical protein
MWRRICPTKSIRRRYCKLQPLEGREGELLLVRTHGFVQQQIVRGIVGDREWIAIASCELKLALVVGAPQSIRRQTHRKRRASWNV